MTELLFPGQIAWYVAVGLAIVAGAMCWLLYRREILHADSKVAKWLPWLRSVAVGLIVFMLAEPTLQHRWRDGTPGKLTIVIDDSESMSLHDDQPRSRYQRAIERLLDPETQLLSRISEEHELRVVRGSSASMIDLWWATLAKTTPIPSQASDWDVDHFQPHTELGELVERDDSSTLVLLTDGRVNQGVPLLEASGANLASRRTIFTVGFGAEVASPELLIQSVEHPDRLFRRDQLSGKVTLLDTMPAGSAFRLQAAHGDELVWEQRLQTQGNGQRAIAFSFPIEPILKKLTQTDTLRAADDASAVPIELRFQLAAEPGQNPLNSSDYPIHLWGALRRSRILLIDGRSRWESRYLKNVFERDPFWELVSVVAESDDLLSGGPRLPSRRDAARFPTSREDLFEFDLVILGDLPLDLLSDEEQEWLVDFVSESGGGMVIIDGQRDSWLDAESKLLGSLLPIDRIREAPAAQKISTTQPARIASDENLNEAPYRPRLAATGHNIPALDLRDGEAGNLDDVWNQLPGFHWRAATKTRPGTEVLATISLASKTNSDSHDVSEESVPFLATRIVGAGRVFYSATDETWRWRYKVADKIHQRFWNQVARWVMRAPYVAEGDFVSLDAGRMNYGAGEAVELRCRLRHDRVAVSESQSVQAIIERDGTAYSIVNLAADPELPGVFQGTIANLPPGHYHVKASAAGIPSEMLDVTTQFHVIAKPSRELSDNTVDTASLKQLAETSGGSYLTEEELPQLIELLKPFRQGKIVESETVLWQSYAWFFPVLILLTAEWLLRKRAGLI